MRLSRISHRCQDGVVAVEFAILLIPLLLLVSGVAEFGRAIYQYDALTKSSRSAARYLSQFAADDPAYPVAMDAATCIAVHGNASCSGPLLVDGLSTSMVVVCDRVREASADCGGLKYGFVETSGAGSPSPTVHLVAVKIIGFQYSPMQSFLNASGITFPEIASVMRQIL
ncbi:TadE/TadG family type IV pilus assembly protein [Cupriavidus oxalaticus]|uniref:Pilus assembly protein n=1 Tax=Cupriavidus oxalaticus TaxID=96344 RepID=A0A5P3VK94_9BURK|nr:TadE/TadG family type IV pilus assembly protein [Cupriavidus oxalaticus]QEZ45833.1 pilus assembly protein [Cupriavidus oxalaticus]